MIKKIVIEVDGREVEFTYEEARELYSELGEIFREQPLVVYPSVDKYDPPWVMPPAITYCETT